MNDYLIASFRTRALAANFERSISAPTITLTDAYDQPRSPRDLTLYELIDYAARGCRQCEREMARRARRGARH